MEISEINDWVLFKGNEDLFEKLMDRDDDCLLKFDNGEIRRFNEEDYPMAEAIYFKPL